MSYAVVDTSADETKVLVKGSATTLAALVGMNAHATELLYVQLFDSATTAAVNLGTTAPTAVVPLAPNGAVTSVDLHRLYLKLGCVYAVTTTATGSTAPTTDPCVMLLVE